MKIDGLDLTQFIEHITPEMMAPVHIPMTRRQHTFLHLSRHLPRFVSRIFLRAFPSLRIRYEEATWPMIGDGQVTRLQIFDMSQGGKLIYDGPPNLEGTRPAGIKVVERDGMFFVPPIHPPHDGQQCPDCGWTSDTWSE